MKAVFSKKDMVRALTHAEIAIKEKMGFSNSSMVCLVAELDSVYVSANNGEVSFSTEVGATVEKEGDVRLPCSKFLRVLKALPDGDLEFFCDEDSKVHLNLVGNKRKRVVILGISRDDSYHLPEVDDKNTFINLEKSYLGEMIAHVSFAAAVQATRYALNGLFLEAKDNNLVMVASDGRCLAVFKALLTDIVSESFSVIIPSGFANDLEKQLLDRQVSGEGPVQIFYEKEKKRIFFQFNNSRTLVSVSTVEGEYPNYQDFIPKGAKNTFSLDKNDLLDALGMCLAMLETVSSSKVLFKLEGEKLTVSASEKSYGDAEQELDIANYSGEAMSIGFNCAMLNAIISKIGNAKSIDFCFDSNEDPVLIKDSAGSGDYQYVLMPMRLQQ